MIWQIWFIQFKIEILKQEYLRYIWRDNHITRLPVKAIDIEDGRIYQIQNGETRESRKKTANEKMANNSRYKKKCNKKTPKIEIWKKTENQKNGKNEIWPKFPKKTAGTKKLPLLLRFFVMRWYALVWSKLISLRQIKQDKLGCPYTIVIPKFII